MNEKLQQLYQRDIVDRKGDIPPDALRENDLQRKADVEKILQQTDQLEAQDYHHAALIFQHGDTLEDYTRAHQLAQTAVEKGDDSARWLAAATLDRSLVTQGRAQKFGTQFRQTENGEWELAQPIDPTTTDEERTEWHVPPLAEALTVFKKKYNLL